MGWDLGVAEIMEFAALSVVVGLIVQMMCGPDAPAWLWVRVSAVYFVVGAWITDAWFGWMTPGALTFEDLLLIVLAPVPAVVLVTRAIYYDDARRPRKRGNRSRPSGHPTPRPL